jgi:hypothetical protein
MVPRVVVHRFPSSVDGHLTGNVVAIPTEQGALLLNRVRHVGAWNGRAADELVAVKVVLDVDGF